LPGTDHDIRLWDLTNLPAEAASVSEPRGKARLLIVACLLLMLVIGFFAVWFFLRQRRSDAGDANRTGFTSR
jgi:hypothetical protein